MKELPLIERAKSHGNRVAFRSSSEERTYQDLIDRSATIANSLLGEQGDLHKARVAYLVPAGFDYASVQSAVWRAGGIAVPLSLSATERELQYTLSDSESSCLVVVKDLSEEVRALCERLQIHLLIVEQVSEPVTDRLLPEIETDRRAMILYTSGTTSKPKGVVTTHATVTAQIETLVNAWQWDPADCIPLFLPLHHIHGIINVMSCALWSGATIEPFSHFEMSVILDRVRAGAYTVFMAVPTIYVKLIQSIESLANDDRSSVVDGFAKMRLMISGSAALPGSVHEKWTELTGQKLLERYGMTEIGMALSNPYHGERLPGMVGQPLPDVEIRLKSEEGDVVTAENVPGEIQVRGPNVFSQYWQREEATSQSFDDGWFQTGDMAVLEGGYYRIMGRQSVDIIKSGGYKLSALEIEAALLEHPAICECAVVGVADETWGEAVAVAVVLAEHQPLDLQSLRSWCEDRVSKYKMPKRLRVVDSLPRNAMGKVTKPAVSLLFDAQG